MKNYIVITTIFEPTLAIERFAALKDYKLIVIGDNKTPKDWAYQGGNYYSIEDQNRLDFKLLKKMPTNHYCRKMIGYLIAASDGAEFIVDTDDDNIPFESWNFPSFDGSFNKIKKEIGFVNMYQLYTNEKIWPRGLPLNLINKDFELAKMITIEELNVGVWQGLADEDPDVDAIYRLTIDKACYFDANEPTVLGKGTVCPFNSQNTMFRRELFPLLYLPALVTFRFTDILRGLVAQPIMWLYDFHLGFTNATVIQKRNPHNYMTDFISEIPMYENAERVIEIVGKEISKSKSISENLFCAYEGLFKANIVKREELEILSDWLVDIDRSAKA